MVQKKKKFDAVEMSRTLRRETGRLLSKMSPKQQMEFLNKRLERFGDHSTSKHLPKAA